MASTLLGVPAFLLLLAVLEEVALELCAWTHHFLKLTLGESCLLLLQSIIAPRFQRVGTSKERKYTTSSNNQTNVRSSKPASKVTN